MFKSFLRKRNSETSVLNTDSFDKRRFEQIYNMSKALKKIEKQEEIPLFKELLGDMWASLYKMNPELKEEDDIPDLLQPNKQLIERMMNEESYQEYRESTRLDDLLSAIGTIKFGEQTKKWLEEQKERDQELQKEIEKIQQLMEQMKQQQEQQKNEQKNQSSNQDNQQEQNKQGAGQDGQGHISNKTEQSLNQAMSDLAQRLSQSLNNNSQSFSQAMSRAVDDTKNTKKGLESLMGGFQAESGKGELQNMPLRQKIALAEIVSHDKKIKEIAKWAGRFTQIARTKQKMKYKRSTEQSGVETGDDLERLLPSELVQYVNPKTKKEFLRKLSEKETLQFEQKGKESLGRGSIILCLDQSGSMRNLETQSKGFALALMAIAKKQKRNFAYIPFDDGVHKVQQFPKGKIKPNEIIAMAKEFSGGGTSFYQPLEKAISVINKDRFNNADIIFITDGEAHVSKSFIEKFNKKKEEKNFHLLSLVIGHRANERTVTHFSDRVVKIRDFNDEGSFEAFEI